MVSPKIQAGLGERPTLERSVVHSAKTNIRSLQSGQKFAAPKVPPEPVAAKLLGVGGMGTAYGDL